MCPVWSSVTFGQQGAFFEFQISIIINGFSFKASASRPLSPNKLIELIAVHTVWSWNAIYEKQAKAEGQFT